LIGVPRCFRVRNHFYQEFKGFIYGQSFGHLSEQNRISFFSVDIDVASAAEWTVEDVHDDYYHYPQNAPGCAYTPRNGDGAGTIVNVDKPLIAGMIT